MRYVEQRLAPLAGKIGFHADFPLDDFLVAGALTVREIRPSNLFGYWRCCAASTTSRPWSPVSQPVEVESHHRRRRRSIAGSSAGASARMCSA